MEYILFKHSKDRMGHHGRSKGGPPVLLLWTVGLPPIMIIYTIRGVARGAEKLYRACKKKKV